MSIQVEQSDAFEASAETGETGLVGTIEVAIIDNDGATVTGPTSANITENSIGGTPTGNYTWNAPAAPADVGQYQIVWSTDGSFDPDTVISEDLLVLEAGALPASPPLVPSESEAGPTSGPCSGWVSAEDAADCCPALVGTDFDLLEDSVTAATEVLFPLSGSQYPGLCTRVVRPCAPLGGCGGWQLLSRGYVVNWSGHTWIGQAPSCSCGSLSRVELPNYPVREVTEVKIDGAVVDPSEYRLDGWRYLTRMRDADGVQQFWPSCQDLDSPSTEEGTFEVSYTHGANPPRIGQLAAGELACQIYQACPTSGGSSTACKLPSGVVRVTSQNVTMDLDRFRAWGWTREKGWHTGLPLVDAFLNAVNPNGLRRRPLIIDPAEVMAEVVGS